MRLETKALILRPWKESDAKSLFEYAKDPLVGPAAGWPAHTSVKNSREIIEHVLSAEGTLALVHKQEAKAIGSIGIMRFQQSHLPLAPDEAEIGYWIGVPYWGLGLVPEALRELQRYAFEELHLRTLWCGYYDGNEKSKRVQEKCGFTYHHSVEKVECKLLDKVLCEHFTCISKEEWILQKSV